MKIATVSLCVMALAQLATANNPAPVTPGSVASLQIAGIGSITDPSGDCRFEGNSERLTIDIPGSDHALDTEQNRMNAPRVLQEVTGDFSAEVTVSGNYPENTVTIVPGRRPFQGAGLLLWVDSGTYIRLERAQVGINVDGSLRHVFYPSWELRLEGKTLRWGNGADGILTSPKTTFRITRIGNRVSGAVSEDGATWRELDPLTVKLPEKVLIGVVAGHDTTTAFQATLEKFTVKPVGSESK